MSFGRLPSRYNRALNTPPSPDAVTTPPPGRLDPTDPAASATPGPSLAAAGRAALTLTLGTFAAQLLIVLRELYLAAEEGASAALDALLVGVVLPTSISGMLTSGAMVALVPAYLAAKSEAGTEQARKVAGAVLLVLLVLGVGAFVLIELSADAAVRVTGSGLDPTGQSAAAGYMRIVAPLTLIMSASSILFAVCQAENRFTAIAGSTVATAATSLVTLLILWPSLGLTGYALGSVLGPLAGLLILMVVSARHSVLPIPVLRARGLGLRGLVRHAVPLTISSSILQLNSVTDVAVASRIAPGAVSALRYGTLLITVPVGAISLAWGRAIFPMLAGSALDHQRSTLATTTLRALRYVIVIFMPVAVLTAVVAPLVVNIAFGRGQFSATDEQLTTLVVVGLAPFILVSMASPTLNSALNAQRKGMVLLAGGIISVTLTVILDIVLGLTIGILGIALATTIANASVAVFFAWRLHRMDRAFDLQEIRVLLVRSFVAVVPGALFGLFVIWWLGSGVGLPAGLLILGLVGVAGVVSYGLFASSLGVAEPMVMARLATRWLRDRLALRRR